MIISPVDVKNCQNIVLGYVSFDGPAEGIPVLVVSNDNAQGGLRIFAPQPLPDFVASDDQEYLDGLIEDWSSRPIEQLPLLMEKLGNLSLGVLRTIGSVTCNSDEVQKIALEFLTRSTHNSGAKIVCFDHQNSPK